MANTTSIATEYLWWDNTEAVTVIGRDYHGAQTEKSLTVARRGGYTADPLIFSDVQSSPEQVAWHLPAALLEELVPDTNTLIRAGSGESAVEYVASRGVVENRLGSSLSHYSCACVRK